MIGYSTILHVLLAECDPERAIQLTIDRNPDNAYSFYKYCRGRIFRDDANRHPRYLQTVRHFQYTHYSPQDPEWDLLQDLMERPLRAQYRVESSRKPFLPNPRLDAALKAIPCLPHAFYAYRMPPAIVEDAVDRLRERREAKHCQQVNISNLQTIVSRALDWHDYTHPWELVACASILCGRRTQEITHTLQFEKHSEHLLEVSGLLKQEIGAGVIPILCTADDFQDLMGKIREHSLPTESSTHRLKPAFRRIFGEWFNHAERRNIYCEAAFRMRDVSGFHPTMSKIMWFDKALCHDTNVVAQVSNLTYQALNFDV